MSGSSNAEELVPVTMGTLHLLCDGEPVTIESDGWWEDGNVFGVDYTIDSTGAKRWCSWPSPRFQSLPK